MEKHGTADEQRATGARPGIQEPAGGARRGLSRQTGQRGQHVRVGSRDLRSARHSLSGRIFQGTHEVPAGLPVQSTEHSFHDKSLAPECI